jgi:hypothetical protein
MQAINETDKKIVKNAKNLLSLEFSIDDFIILKNII